MHWENKIKINKVILFNFEQLFSMISKRKLGIKCKRCRPVLTKKYIKNPFLPKIIAIFNIDWTVKSSDSQFLDGTNRKSFRLWTNKDIFQNRQQTDIWRNQKRNRRVLVRTKRGHWFYWQCLRLSVEVKW